MFALRRVRVHSKAPFWLCRLQTQEGVGDTASVAKQVKIAVVGSGPAGFYFTDRILKLLHNDVRVDIIDRLPTPFGLVRSGVAPDHPDTKNVINKFTGVASDARVRFFGNVHVGRDVTVPELKAMYECVLLSYGASEDRALGISGESVPGIFSAREFVNWYNGHPDFVGLPVDLSSTQSVGVVGLGNVALDCARILLRPADALATTDIAAHALEQLRRSAVTTVHIIGRRGPLQAQFSGKELRELLNMTNISVSMHPADYAPTSLDEKEPRKNQKGFAEMRKAHGKVASCDPKRQLHFHFLRSPVECLADPDTGRLAGTAVEVMHLEADGDVQRARGTGATEVIPMQMLLRSVGYRALSMEGVPFDNRNSVVPNVLGRVVAAPGAEDTVPGLYVAGWLKRGPQGIIGTNLVDAQQTAQCVIEDLPKLAPVHSDADALGRLLQDRGVQYVRWEDWMAIDAAEVEAGRKRNQPRIKFTSISQMLDVCGR